MAGEPLVAGCLHTNRKKGERGALGPHHSVEAALFRGLWQARRGELKFVLLHRRSMRPAQLCGGDEDAPAGEGGRFR